MRVLPSHAVPTASGLVAICLSLQQIAVTHGFRLTDTAHDEVVRYVKDRASRRLIYCGTRVAKLAVAMRVLNPDSHTVIIRGDKLDRAVFTPEGFEEFARRYGVDTVVLEPANEPRQWSRLVDSPAPSMVRVRVVPNAANKLDDIRIFDFRNPSSHPESTLDVPINYTDGGSVTLSL